MLQEQQKLDGIKNEQARKDRVDIDAWTREARQVRKIIVDGREAILLS